MKKLIFIITVLLLSCLVFGITDNEPADKVIIGQYSIETQRQLYDVEVKDDKGNYGGNLLRIKIWGNVGNISAAGLAPWPPDPNYLVVLNAIPNPTLRYDPNDPNHVADPNIVQRLSGSFSIGKTWEPGHHEIAIQVFDSRGHNDCKWLIVDANDYTAPTIGGCTKQE